MAEQRERAKVGGEPPPEPEAEEAFRMLEMTPGNFRLADPVVKTIRGELMTYKKAVTLARTVAHYRRGRHELKIGRAVIDTLLPQTVQARDRRAAADGRRGDSRTTVTSRARVRFACRRASPPAGRSATNRF